MQGARRPYRQRRCIRATPASDLRGAGHPQVYGVARGRHDPRTPHGDRGGHHWGWQHLGSQATNASHVNDPTLTAVVKEQRGTKDLEARRQLIFDVQRYVVENMITTSISSFGFLQAVRSYVKGYENLQGYKLRFETTWLHQ